MGRGRLRKREGLVDNHLELAARRFVYEALDHVVRAIGRDLGAQEHSGQGTIARHQRRDIDGHRLAARRTHHRDSPAIGERHDAALQRRTADRIDHQVNTLVVGQAHHRFRDVGVAVVDAVIHSQRTQAFETLVARGSRENLGARALGKLDRGDADTTGAGLHEDRLAGLEAAELEQAIVGGAERNRDGGRQLHVEAFRDRPRVAGGHRAQGSVRAEIKYGGDFLANAKIGYLRADCYDLAGRLVADHVRRRHQGTAPSVERVAALDTDGLDADHDAFRMTYRIGHVLVFQDGWISVLVIDCGFHWTTSGYRCCIVAIENAKAVTAPWML